MYKTLNSKLILIFIVFIIAVMATVGVFLTNSVFDYYNDTFFGEIDNAFAGNVSERIDEALKSDDYVQSLRDVLIAYSASFGFDAYRSFCILDENGNVLLSGDDTVTSVAVTENIAAALNGKTGKKAVYGAKYLDYAAYESAAGHTCIIYIYDDLTEMQSLTAVLLSIIVKSLIIGLVIAVIMAFFLARAISLPIGHITSGTLKIASGDYSERLTNRSRDEIGTLARNFNAMAEVIEDNLDAVTGEREKLNNIINKLEAGVAAFDDKGKLLHLNPSARRLLSLPENACPSFSEFCAVMSLDDITMKKVRKEKEIHIAEHTLSDVSSRELIVSVDIAVFSYEKGKKNGFIAVFQNITEGAVLEKSRREFIANVSHELRTPLTSIKGATETVLEDDEMPLSFRNKFLNIVQNEADRMTRIVKDLLVLSRLDNRRMTWSPSSFDIGETLDRMCTALQTEARGKKHSLTYTSHLSDKLPMYGDKERIEQVIANIIGNAVKYTPEGGQIDVTLDRCEPFDYRITVKDNGVGIPAEDIPHVFERFYRVDKSRSIQAGGTGLGLSIAKEIIDAHGGTIEIDSKEGVGTSISVNLPKDTRLNDVPPAAQNT